MNNLHTAPSKVVLLTGVSSGIGETTARWLAGQGHQRGGYEVASAGSAQASGQVINISSAPFLMGCARKPTRDV